MARHGSAARHGMTPQTAPQACLVGGPQLPPLYKSHNWRRHAASGRLDVGSLCCIRGPAGISARVRTVKPKDAITVLPCIHVNLPCT